MTFFISDMTDVELNDKRVKLDRELSKLEAEASDIRCELHRVQAEQYRRYRQLCDKIKEAL